VISFVILWGMGVDFALFWAVVIGLFNYIPYVGSIVGVALPVILSVAQFGSLGTTALLGTLLIAAQTYVGNILEPRVIGRQLNLSPFVVLVALSVWSSVWGLPGAILAIPMTSMMAIICGAFGPTRFVAVLLADRSETEERG
jgi:AI-2 transport protein TqsA